MERKTFGRDLNEERCKLIENQCVNFDSVVPGVSNSLAYAHTDMERKVFEIHRNHHVAEMGDCFYTNITNTDGANSDCFLTDDKKDIENSFVIVKFLDSNSLAVIPNKWFYESEGQCLWPAYEAPRLDTAVKRLESPGKSPVWKRYDVALKKKFNSYDSAQRKLKDYENSSYNPSSAKVKKVENIINWSESYNSDDENEQKAKRQKIQEVKKSNNCNTVVNSIAQYENNIQIPGLSDGLVTSVLNSVDVLQSSLNQSLPSAADADELVGDKFIELARLLLKNQQMLDQKITELRKEINNKINFILQHIPQFNNIYAQKKFLTLFPLSSIEDYDSIDELLVDPENANSLISYLSPGAGPTVRNCVNGMMKLLLKDSLCAEVGLTSKSRKRSFHDTNLMKCLHGAILRRTGGVTTKELHCCVGEWFRRYKDRLYGRRRPSELKNGT